MVGGSASEGLEDRRVIPWPLPNRSLLGVLHHHLDLLELDEGGLGAAAERGVELAVVARSLMLYWRTRVVRFQSTVPLAGGSRATSPRWRRRSGRASPVRPGVLASELVPPAGTASRSLLNGTLHQLLELGAAAVGRLGGVVAVGVVVDRAGEQRQQARGR